MVCFILMFLFHYAQHSREPVPQNICGGFSVHRRRLILQCGRRIISAADDAADPWTRVDRIENGFVNICLRLQINSHCAYISIRSAECHPIKTSTTAICNTAASQAGGRWISERENNWFVDKRR